MVLWRWHTSVKPRRPFIKAFTFILPTWLCCKLYFIAHHKLLQVIMVMSVSLDTDVVITGVGVIQELVLLWII